MRYSDSSAFRRALEDRLNAQAVSTGQSLSRLRKLVAFERFLARLAANHPGVWLLKGGLALQWRYAGMARTTRDLDLLLVVSAVDVHAELVRAALLDMGDWFTYVIQQPTRRNLVAGGAQRFGVAARLDGRPFETFHLDVGWGDPVLEPADLISAPSLLAFAGLEPVLFPCYPLSQHLAEKVHALTQPHAAGASSRVKDLVDVLLISDQESLGADGITAAIAATFGVRNTHAVPPTFPEPPDNWRLPYGRMAMEVGLAQTDLASAIEQARRFLEPILQHRAHGTWDPQTGEWHEAPSPDG
jgi:hypothetical protein